MTARLAPRVALLGALALASACLRPVGFPWGDDATSTATSSTSTSPDLTSGPATTTAATTADPTLGGSSTTSDPTTTTGPADATTSDTAASTATTEPAPVCGDGVVDPGEDCDDANDDDEDGCNQQCGRDRLVFVTGATFSGDVIHGVGGGDTICRDAAEAAGLARPLAFKAWLSDRTTHARDRLAHVKGRYLRVDGLVVAHDWDDLLDGELENPILITETGGIYKSGVWTGTKPDGTRGVGADHCLDWTLADAFNEQNGGFFGYAQEFDEVWTWADESYNPGACSGELALYCFEQ